MRISQSKMKVMAVGKDYIKHSVIIHIKQLEQVSELYLISQDRKLDEESKERQDAVGRFF